MTAANAKLTGSTTSRRCGRSMPPSPVMTSTLSAASSRRGRLASVPLATTLPKGAILDYYLKSKAADKEEITIEISDAQGKRVRRLSNHKESKGRAAARVARS